MHIVTDPTDQPASKPTPAAKYRAANQHRLMLLTKLTSVLPTRGDFCRIKAVETVAPDLWITVGFFDGSTKGLRPDKLRAATEEEERFSNGLLDPEMV